MYFSPFLRISSAFDVLLLVLSGCSFLVPEDPSGLRYNTVGGERHRPQLNSMTPQGSAAPIATVPVAQNMNDGSPFPPVDASTQARAQAQLNAPMDPNARHAPAENGRGEIAVSANYPNLSDVPPRPLMNGDDSAAAQMGRVRSELEQDRTNSMAVREQLNRDAAEEPSMLKKMLDNGPPWQTLPTAVSPQEKKPAGSSMNLYNSRSYSGVPEPINLRAPVNTGPTSRIIQHAPTANSMAPASSSGFNPMADVTLTDGSLAVTYAGDGYLPSSRYANQR